MRTPPARLQSAAGWVVTCIGRSSLLPYGGINHPAITAVFERAAALLVFEAHGCTPSPQPGQAPLSVDLRGHTPGRLAPRLIPSAHPDNHPDADIGSRGSRAGPELVRTDV